MSRWMVAALLLGPSAALAQDEPATVGVSVSGVVVEAPVEAAAIACGVDAKTLLAEWEQIGTELSTIANTAVRADTIDLAPGVAAGTPMVPDDGSLTIKVRRMCRVCQSARNSDSRLECAPRTG